MPPDTLSALYYIICACFFLALVFSVLKKIPWAGWALSAGTLACGAGVLLLVITKHRLPLYGAFESAVYMLFILSLLERFACRSDELMHYKRRTGIITCSVMLLVLALQINAPKQFHHDFFMYEDLWVNLFFNLRLVAAAFFIHAAVLLNAAAWKPPEVHPADSATAGPATAGPATAGPGAVIKNMSFEPACTQCHGDAYDRETAIAGFSTSLQKIIMYRARNFLLTGIVIYLASEWSGSLWCLNWLGDTWRWSGGFFKSTVIFLLVMASFHLPPSFAKSLQIRAIIGSGPALFIIWMIFYH